MCSSLQQVRFSGESLNMGPLNMTVIKQRVLLVLNLYDKVQNDKVRRA